MTDRKKPVRHIVSSYKRKNKTVRSYDRGSGTASSKPKGKIIKSFVKSDADRWEEIPSSFDYQWRSKENPHITVNVNKEERDADELEEEYGDDYDNEELGYMYLVFPSYDNRGIPSSPEIYDEGSSGSFAEAKKDALKLAHKILKLPIEKIESFNWNMVD